MEEYTEVKKVKKTKKKTKLQVEVEVDETRNPEERNEVRIPKYSPRLSEDNCSKRFIERKNMDAVLLYL